MLRGVVPALEKHHNVRILDEGLEAAVKLSHRYLPDRQLPDKAVSVLDTACARLALGQNVDAGGHRGLPRARSTISPCRRACCEREAAVGRRSRRAAGGAGRRCKDDDRSAAGRR